MLKDYKGGSNSSEVFPYLVGEKIKAVFEYDHHIYIVVDNGHAFSLTSMGGNIIPAMWVERPDKVMDIILRLKSNIKKSDTLLKSLIALKPKRKSKTPNRPAVKEQR